MVLPSYQNCYRPVDLGGIPHKAEGTGRVATGSGPRERFVAQERGQARLPNLEVVNHNSSQLEVRKAGLPPLFDMKDPVAPVPVLYSSKHVASLFG